jgi:hypothetical protein
MAANAHGSRSRRGGRARAGDLAGAMQREARRYLNDRGRGALMDDDDDDEDGYEGYGAGGEGYGSVGGHGSAYASRAGGPHSGGQVHVHSSVRDHLSSAASFAAHEHTLALFLSTDLGVPQNNYRPYEDATLMEEIAASEAAGGGVEAAPLPVAASALLAGLPHADAGQTCSVCLDDVTDPAASVLTECGHPFHALCLARWHRTQEHSSYSGAARTCPVCRTAARRCGPSASPPAAHANTEQAADEGSHGVAAASAAPSAPP